MVGEFIKINSGKSYRLGLELGTLAKVSEKLNIFSKSYFESRIKM